MCEIFAINVISHASKTNQQFVYFLNIMYIYVVAKLLTFLCFLCVCVCMCLPIHNYEDHYVFTHQRCEDHRSCEDRYLVPVNIIVLIGLNRQITLRRTTFAVVLITQV